MNATRTPLIIVCDPIHEAGLNRLRQVGRVLVLERGYTTEELMDVARDADALIVRSRTTATRNEQHASDRKETDDQPQT